MMWIFKDQLTPLIHNQHVNRKYCRFDKAFRLIRKFLNNTVTICVAFENRAPTRWITKLDQIWGNKKQIFCAKCKQRKTNRFRPNSNNRCDHCLIICTKIYIQIPSMWMCCMLMFIEAGPCYSTWKSALIYISNLHRQPDNHQRNRRLWTDIYNNRNAMRIVLHMHRHRHRQSANSSLKNILN